MHFRFLKDIEHNNFYNFVISQIGAAYVLLSVENESDEGRTCISQYGHDDCGWYDTDDVD